ncbi:hypothetical protein LBMAG27_07190 [Bacteroidota bacterium]|nr:hypothetical protein LBMAG27_07190 [Bacteroidota bacterium]
MNKQPINMNNEEAEISFKNIFSSLKNNFRYILRKWWILLLSIIIGGVFGYLVSVMYGVSYSSNCAFTVQGQSASSSLLNSALSLASTLGISGKPGSGSYDNTFFANLIKSRRIIKESLLKEEVIDGKKRLLANHYINFFKLNEKWEGDKRLNRFNFKNNSFNKLTRLEDSVLSLVYNMILDNNFIVTASTDAPFNNAKFVSPNLNFSKTMMKNLIENTNSYYMTEMYYMNNKSLLIAERRVDSLANAIKQLDGYVAKLKDNTNNVVKQSGFLELNDAIRNQGLLNIQYSSAVSNFELAKVTLMTATPVLEIIDDPLFSTEVILIDPLGAIIVGAIVLFILTILFLIVLKIIKSSIEKEIEIEKAATNSST